MNRGYKRYRRTIFLAVLAMASLIWAAIDQFGVPPEEMARLFLYSAGGVLLIILAAAVTVGVFQLVKKLFRRG